MADHQLPAYLQNRTVPDFTDYAGDGIGGLLPPHVSIRGNKFTLVDAAGQEFQPMDIMDAVIVDRSTVTCKMFFGQPWKPGAEDPPKCWSTNGIGPSRDAIEPQARTCAECPNNVRGSAVSVISGAAIKACRDEYHLAVLLPLVPTMMFRYVLTPGSFKNWQAYTGKFKNSNVKISMVVTRLSFVPKVNGEVQFESVSYVDEATNGLVQKALIEKATDLLVGRLDTPRVAALAAPAVHGQVQQHPGTVESDLPPLRMGASGGQAAPFVLAPAATSPAPMQATQAGPASSVATQGEPAPVRRRRRTAAEMQAAGASAPNGQAAPAASAAPQAPFPHPGTTQVPPNQFGIGQGQPAASNPELSGMLDDFFIKQG